MKQTPVYRLPYLQDSDRPRQFAKASQDIVEAVEAALLASGNPPVDGDVESILRRLAALETTPRSVTYTGSRAIPVSAETLLNNFSQTQPTNGRPAFVLGNTGGIVTLAPGAYDIKARGRWSTRPATATRSFLTLRVGSQSDDNFAWRNDSGQEDSVSAFASAFVPADATTTVQLSAYNNAGAATMTAQMIINKVA